MKAMNFYKIIFAVVFLLTAEIGLAAETADMPSVSPGVSNGASNALSVSAQDQLDDAGAAPFTAAASLAPSLHVAPKNSFISTAVPVHARPSNGKLDSIVAVVNDDVITESELDKKIAFTQQELSQMGGDAPQLSASQLREKVLNQYIDFMLQLQIAKRNNIDIPNDDLNAAIVDIAKRNHMTLEEFKHNLAAHAMSYEEFRQNIHDQMLLSHIAQQAVGHKISISDQEIAAFMQEHKIDRKEAEEALYQKKFVVAAEEWLKDLRKNAYIKIN